MGPWERTLVLLAMPNGQRRLRMRAELAWVTTISSSEDDSSNFLAWSKSVWRLSYKAKNFVLSIAPPLTILTMISPHLTPKLTLGGKTSAAETTLDCEGVGVTATLASRGSSNCHFSRADLVPRAKPKSKVTPTRTKVFLSIDQLYYVIMKI